MVRKSLFARLFGLSKSSTETMPPRTKHRAGVPEPVSRIGAAVKNGAGSTPSPGTAPRTDQGSTGPGTANGPGTSKGSGQSPAFGADVSAVKVERVASEPLGGRDGDLGKSDRGAGDRGRAMKPAKLAPQEELTLKINEGIENLSGLLVRIDDKLADQNRHRELLARRLEKLPDVLETVARTQKDNLEATREVAKAVSTQSESLQGTALSLQKVPGAVDGLGQKLDDHAKAGALVKDSVETVGRSVRSLADGTQRAQNTLLAEFRRAQDEHRRRLEDLVDRERRVYYTVSVLGVAVVVSMIIVIVKLTG